MPGALADSLLALSDWGPDQLRSVLGGRPPQPSEGRDAQHRALARRRGVKLLRSRRDEGVNSRLRTPRSWLAAALPRARLGHRSAPQPALTAKCSRERRDDAKCLKSFVRQPEACRYPQRASTLESSCASLSFVPFAGWRSCEGRSSEAQSISERRPQGPRPRESRNLPFVAPVQERTGRSLSSRLPDPDKPILNCRYRLWSFAAEQSQSSSV